MVTGSQPCTRVISYCRRGDDFGEPDDFVRKITGLPPGHLMNKSKAQFRQGVALGSHLGRVESMELALLLSDTLRGPLALFDR